MRFRNAVLAMIGKPNHPCVLDGRPEQWMGLQQHPTILAPIRNHPKIRRTEVRPISNLRAISDLLTPVRCSLRISGACRAAATCAADIPLLFDHQLPTDSSDEAHFWLLGGDGHPCAPTCC